MTHTAYVTHAELAELVQLLNSRFDRLERALNRYTLILGTAVCLVFLTEVLVLWRVGR